MLNTANLNKVNIDIPLIKNNYEVLIFYDEPLLMTGYNKYGNRIISSLLENTETSSIYLNAIITKDIFISFTDKQITFYDLLYKYSDLFLVEKYNNDKNDIFEFRFDLIPEEYLPKKDSFCPDFIKNPTYSYSVKLDGGKADSHLIPPAIFKDVVSNVTSIFNNSIGLAKTNVYDFDLYAGARAASLDIEFQIEVKQVSTNIGAVTPLFDIQDKLKKFIMDYLEYCTKYVVKEYDKLLNKRFEETTHFNNLIDSYKDIRISSGEIFNSDNAIENVLEFVEKNTHNFISICNNIGSSFKTVDFFVYDNNHNLREISHINNETSPAVIESISEAELSRPDIHIDSDYKEYKIVIYSLNIHSRKGKARMKKLNSLDEFCNPSFVIEGTESLEKSIFTNSLDKQKEITIRAIATRRDIEYKHLKISEEHLHP